MNPMLKLLTKKNDNPIFCQVLFWLAHFKYTCSIALHWIALWGAVCFESVKNGFREIDVKKGKNMTHSVGQVMFWLAHEHNYSLGWQPNSDQIVKWGRGLIIMTWKNGNKRIEHNSNIWSKWHYHFTMIQLTQTSH